MEKKWVVIECLGGITRVKLFDVFSDAHAYFHRVHEETGVWPQLVQVD